MVPGQHEPVAADIAALTGLYDSGRFLSAWRRCSAFAPLESWNSPDALALAGRLVRQLGDGARCDRLHRRAWRLDPGHPEAADGRIRIVWARRGPLAAWEAMDAHPPRGADEGLPSWEGLRAELLVALRDLSAATPLVDRLVALDLNDPWLGMLRPYLLQAADDVEGAYAACLAVLARWPRMRPAVQLAGELLVKAGRAAEAEALLAGAEREMESYWVTWHLLLLQSELEMWEAAESTATRCAQLAPLADDSLREALATRRANNAWRRGDHARARAHAAEVGRDLGARLATADSTAPRRVLPLPIVLQDHLTCGPATLASILSFQGVPGDQAEIVDAIWYAGTENWRERAWCTERGLAVREFSVTWASASALIDRAIPFAMTTRDTASSHLQAVAGYDAGLRTLVIRDPGSWYRREEDWDDLARRYAPVGLRGLAVVPPERAAELAALDLPDAALHDRVYELNAALARHDRVAAGAAVAALGQLDPTHQLTLEAQLALSAYDGDQPARLATAQELLRRHDDDPRAALRVVASLNALERPADARVLLERLGRGSGADPVIRAQLAQYLGDDPRRRGEARTLARRVLRRLASDGSCYYILANLLDHPEDRWRCMRWAACLTPGDESFARRAFEAARACRRTEEALDLLRWRRNQAQQRSSEPAVTLAWALERVDRDAEAFALLLDEAGARPEDGELLLALADHHMDRGAVEEARAALVRAETRCRRGVWLRAAARIHGRAGDTSAARVLLEEAVAAEPDATDLHRWLARLLAEAEGAPAAIDHLRRALERLPQSRELGVALIEWLRSRDPAAAAELAETQVRQRGEDVWWIVQRGWLRRDMGDLDGSAADAATARELAPQQVETWNLSAEVARARGERGAAAAAYRRALELSVDATWSVERWLDLAGDAEGRRAVLAVFRQELRRQVVYGDALTAYARLAAPLIPPEELEAHLRDVLAAHPDLWQAWCACALHLRRLGRASEAAELLRACCARFPVLARVRVDLAGCLHDLDDRAGERAALEQAESLAPSWSAPARLRSLVHEAEGELTAALATLERAVRIEPLDAINHGFLGDLLLKLGRPADACAALVRAIDLDPAYGWAWAALSENEAAGGCAGRALELARAHAARRKADVRAQLNLARQLDGAGQGDERLEALERAVAADPHHGEANDSLAAHLAASGRIAEARAACDPPAFGGRPPTILRLRRARIEARETGLERGITALRELLRAEPRHEYALELLAQWLQETGRVEESVVEAERLVGIAPGSPSAWCTLGAAYSADKRTTQAISAWRKALALDHDFPYAADALVTAHLEERQAADALSAAAHLARISPGSWSDLRLVQARCLAGDRQGAVEAFERLASRADPSTHAIERAHEALVAERWEEDAWRILNRTVGSGAEALAAVWGGQAAERMGVRSLPRIAELGQAAGDAALAAVLERAAETAQLTLLRRTVDLYRDRLRHSTWLWGKTGYALCRIGQSREALAWMADWSERPDAEPWMLANACAARDALGRDAEMLALHRRALEVGLRHSDDTTLASHRCWAQFEEALRGEPASVTPSDSDSEGSDVLRLIVALSAAMRSGDPLAHWRQAIRTAPRSVWESTRLRRAALRSLRRVTGPGIRGWLKARWYRLRHV